MGEVEELQWEKDDEKEWPAKKFMKKSVRKARGKKR